MRSMTRVLLTGSGLACLLAAGMTSTAHAATGRLTLIGDAGAATVVYDGCEPPRTYRPQPFPLNAFDNRPSPGCQAELINRAGASRVLCVGRGDVPIEFRQAVRVVIRPGTAPACGFEPAGASGHIDGG